jgi:hypothetical protein
MACRLVALDKSPGVRPVGIGEVYRRLLAKCLLEAVGHTATAAAGNLNLCAGLPAGIEGAMHAIRQEMDAPPIQPAPPGPDPFEVLLRQPRRDSTGSREEADMRAGLPPEPGRSSSMPGTGSTSWAVEPCSGRSGTGGPPDPGSHSTATVILRRKGRPGYTLLSSEGVTQGDLLLMVLYGLALVPLAKKLRQEHPEVVQAWYADDGLLKGRTSQVAAAMTLL